MRLEHWMLFIRWQPPGFPGQGAWAQAQRGCSPAGHKSHTGLDDMPRYIILVVGSVISREA